MMIITSNVSASLIRARRLVTLLRSHFPSAIRGTIVHDCRHIGKSKKKAHVLPVLVIGTDSTWATVYVISCRNQGSHLSDSHSRFHLNCCQKKQECRSRRRTRLHQRLRH